MRGGDGWGEVEGSARERARSQGGGGVLAMHAWAWSRELFPLHSTDCALIPPRTQNAWDGAKKGGAPAGAHH